jgi:hypothetical protein
MRENHKLLVSTVMHREYEHESYKWQNRKRYLKEDIKSYRNKRLRKRAKLEEKKLLNDCC